MNNIKEIKIVLVDDHKLLRDGIRKILEQRSNMHIIGEASDGREAVKICSKLIPDIIVMDVAMPGMNGIEAAKQIHQNQPNIKIIGLSRDPENSDFATANVNFRVMINAHLLGSGRVGI